MSRHALVLTVSDSRSEGRASDDSGDLAEKWLRAQGMESVAREVVPDEREQIEDALRRAQKAGIALVLTTGGTGLGPRDITPEATKAVIDREALGLAEVMRSAGRAHTPLAALSRATAGTAGRTLIVNLPGSSKAVEESLGPLGELLDHALALLEGRGHH